MSGEKRRYVSVEEAELRRLREQESRLRSIQQDLPERLNAVAQQARREFQQRLAPFEERAQRQEQESRRLKSGLANLEQDTHRRLRQQRNEFQAAVREAESRQQQGLQREKTRLESAMQSGFEQQRREYLRIAREQRQEYTRLLGEQDEKFTRLVVDERQARERGQKILQQQIDEIESDRSLQGQLARDLLSDVQAIWERIDREYQHQRFAPGRLADLRRSLDLAKGNIETGVSQAAIATSQQTYLSLVDLRFELEQKEQEWLLLYNAALTDLRSLIAEVQANRECEIEVGEGSDTEKFKFEVDYWVNGSVAKYERELSELESKLTGGEATLSTSQLKELGAQIEGLQPRLGEIVETAKLAILSSQLRAEIADRVVDVLSSLGYTSLEPDSDAIYEGNDPRASYVVKVKNIAGDEVVTVISPDKEFGANSISINTFSPILVDEKATEENAKAIFEILEEEGVKGNSPMECNSQARDEYRDMQVVKDRQVAPASSQQLRISQAE